MTFLFDAITLNGLDRFYYKVCRSEKNEYFAEHFYLPGIGWHSRWINNEWVAEDPDLQYQAEQLGSNSFIYCKYKQNSFKGNYNRIQPVKTEKRISF